MIRDYLLRATLDPRIMKERNCMFRILSPTADHRIANVLDGGLMELLSGEVVQNCGA